jgi:branched-chain amino acid transport system substrate-binding protein
MGALVVGAVAALALAACGSSSSEGGGDESGGASGGVYHIGAGLILSGPASSYGANMSGGMAAYFDYINDQGGVNGKKIQVDQADAGLTADLTIQAVKQLVQQDHDIVIGGMLASSGNSGAASTIAALKTTALLGTPGSDVNVPPPNPYMFGAGGSLYTDEAYEQAQFAKDNVFKESNPKVAIIYFTSAETEAWNKTIQQLGKDGGWNIVDTEVYQVGTTEFSAQAAKIKAADPDYIIAAFDTSNIAFIKALQAVGVTVPIITNQGGPHADQMADLNYPNLYVGRPLVYPVGDDQVVTDYLARVKQYGGNADPQSHITQYGYLQAQVIVEVLKQCGADCDAESFNKTISGMTSNDTGGFAFGPVTYSPDNTVGAHTDRFYKWDPTTKQPVLMDGTYTHP